MGRPVKEPSLLMLEVLLRGLPINLPYLGRTFTLRLEEGRLVYDINVKRVTNEGKLIQRSLSCSRLDIPVDDFVEACNSMTEKDLWKAAGDLDVDIIEKGKAQGIE